jgi:hypothetical protein
MPYREEPAVVTTLTNQAPLPQPPGLIESLTRKILFLTEEMEAVLISIGPQQIRWSK